MLFAFVFCTHSSFFEGMGGRNFSLSPSLFSLFSLSPSLPSSSPSSSSSLSSVISPLTPTSKHHFYYMKPSLISTFLQNSIPTPLPLLIILGFFTNLSLGATITLFCKCACTSMNSTIQTVESCSDCSRTKCSKELGSCLSGDWIATCFRKWRIPSSLHSSFFLSFFLSFSPSLSFPYSFDNSPRDPTNLMSNMWPRLMYNFFSIQL